MLPFLRRISIEKPITLFHVRNCFTTPSPATKQELTEEEIEEKRNISRLPEKIFVRNVRGEYTTPEHTYEYNISLMRRHYAKFGANSGINPGIMWPDRDQLSEEIEYEERFYPKYTELLANTKKALEEEQEAKIKREQEVLDNLKKLKEWRKALLMKEIKKQRAEEEARQKREELIREVREYIGYNVDPNDPRFKEVMEMKEQQRKEAERLAKKQAKKEKMLQKLMTVGAEKETTKKTQESNEGKTESSQ